ncbi:unnamed protein product [Pylaiella littoralis]
MGAPRKSSASATGGRMLNPYVEPAARRESAQERRDSEGKERRNPARANSRENKKRLSVGRSGSIDAGISSSVLAGQGAASTTSTAAVLEARNQRRSIGLKRLSVNAHLKETLIHALEGVARDVRVGTEATGIDKLQTIMTKAKETGLGVSNLFHFFLLQPDGTKRGSIEGKPSKLPEESEDSKKPNDQLKHEAIGGVFKETQSSKTRAESTRGSRGGGKKKSMEMGNRPGTANSKRTSAGATVDAEHGRPSGSPRADEPATNEGASAASGRRKSSLARRSSSTEEAMMRDRLITTASFQHGLTTLGFKLSDKARHTTVLISTRCVLRTQEAETVFQHLDSNNDGNIDLAEFTRFCLEIPSMPWKAERARRGILGNNPGVHGDRELDRAARDMANETIAVSDAAEFGSRVDAAGPAKLEPVVDLGKIVYRGEKFFWRTKDLIEVVIQLNEKKQFLAIPANASAEAEILNDIKSKILAAKTDLDMGVTGGGGENNGANTVCAGQTRDKRETLREKAHMAYVADYIVHRITMPDGNGNLLQPDVTRPEEEVNPALPQDGKHGGSTAKTRRGSAVARPGLMRTTFDEWDTLMFSNPPRRVEGAPQFPKTKKRESYFQEFCSVTEAFQENRVKAHRLSNEAAELAMQVSNTLAPLNHSASAPASLPLHESQRNSNGEASANGNPRPGSGRVVLKDDISSTRRDR